MGKLFARGTKAVTERQKWLYPGPPGSQLGKPAPVPDHTLYLLAQSSRECAEEHCSF